MPAVSLKLEGRLVGPWVGETRALCEALLAENRLVELNLAEVLFVDQEGVALLQELKLRGIALLDCSLYVNEQLKQARIANSSRPPEP